MQKISSQKLAEIVGATSRIFQTEIENVVTDSRIAQKGDLFVAIRGEKNDGHNYAADVLKKGAELVMVDHIVPDLPIERQVVVQIRLKLMEKSVRIIVLYLRELL